MRGRLRRQSVAGIVAAMLAVAGCSNERTFGAQEFVDEVRAEGVELKLGEPLITDDESKQIYAVELEPLKGAEPPVPAESGDEHGNEDEHGHEHGGGSLSVYDEIADADMGMESCRAAADLLCYQAANVVVILESAGIEAQRLGVAMERLAEE
jgi:hypothetical protein